MRIYKTNPADAVVQANNELIVSWNESYAIGIELIVSQHKHLFDLANQLYQACRHGGDSLDTVFKETMSRMVEYVRFHFTEEQELLKRVKYPKYAEHKSKHDELIKEILETTKHYGDGKKFVPNSFVRSLKDWIVSHIGYYDRMYAAFIADQKKKGLLSDEDIRGPSHIPHR